MNREERVKIPNTCTKIPGIILIVRLRAKSSYSPTEFFFVFCVNYSSDRVLRGCSLTMAAIVRWRVLVVSTSSSCGCSTRCGLFRQLEASSRGCGLTPLHLVASPHNSQIDHIRFTWLETLSNSLPELWITVSLDQRIYLLVLSLQLEAGLIKNKF